MPESEVVDLDATNTDQYPHDLRKVRLEGQCWIEAGPTLLDECKMKSRRIRDRLHAGLLRVRRRNWLPVARRRVVIAHRYCRLVLDDEGPFQFCSEIGVLRAAVPCIPT